MRLELRAWQSRFVGELADHDSDDFLLVACPAAGKTIAAAAGAARAMEVRDCDQLVIVAPTIVVRDQWVRVLGSLGYRVQAHFGADGWPDYVHGVCVTYAQVSMRADQYAQACVQRRTVVVFDEIHHAGHHRSWGDAIATGFADAKLRLMLSGTPFRSDRERIPFMRYTPDGECDPDFAYGYAQAVRDGVCRPVEFKAHNGTITWLEGQEEVTARFSEPVLSHQRPARLRASLDPSQAYLAAILADAHEDLLTLREQVPDAAGLVVCDSQAHALEVDRLLSEVTNGLPVLAMSDIPRAHQAIADFADDDEQWLVSVRMVAEGVDIPRLGVIVWATAASTELMVRQVAGRALRGRGAHARLPAIVHIPADPQLKRYAKRLNVLGGVTLRAPSSGPSGTPHGPRKPVTWAPSECKEIDATPFVEWFDKQAGYVGADTLFQRMGWSYDAGTRALHRYRNEGARASALTIYDACHMLGIDFYELFSGPEYAAARAFVANPIGVGTAEFGTVNAHPTEHQADVITPDMPATGGLAVTGPAVEIEVATPDLPDRKSVV